MTLAQAQKLLELGMTRYKAICLLRSLNASCTSDKGSLILAGAEWYLMYHEDYGIDYL